MTLISELGLVGTFIIGLMLFQCFKDMRQVRVRLTPLISMKRGQAAQEKEDVRVYLARAMEGSLIAFIVSGVFISILWYPSLWIMMAFVVALRNISQVAEIQLPSGRLPKRHLMPSSM